MSDNLYSLSVGHMHESRVRGTYIVKSLHLSLEPKGPQVNQPSRHDTDQSINQPFHQWIVLYTLSNSYEPGPPTQETIQAITQSFKEILPHRQRTILTWDSTRFHLNRRQDDIDQNSISIPICLLVR